MNEGPSDGDEDRGPVWLEPSGEEEVVREEMGGGRQESPTRPWEDSSLKFLKYV